MKLFKILDEFEKSKIYKEFRKSKETKDAFFCATFLIMNFKNNTFELSFDFRNEKEIFTFRIPSNKKLKEEIVIQKEAIIPSRKQLEKIDEKNLKKINIKVDIEDLKEIVEQQLKNHKIKNPLIEIIAVFQMLNNKLVWNLTCICEGFIIVSLQIDASSGVVLEFKKKNLFDFISVKKPDKEF